jgi:hypothetical protein
MSPVGAALFSGVLLIVLVYSTLDSTGLASRWGAWGTVFPLPIIGVLMFGIYLGVKRIRQHRLRIGIKDPLYLRSQMNQCLERTCGGLESRLKTPELASAAIFYAILLDKTLHIGATDCLRYSDVRQQIEDSGLKGTGDLMLCRFFQSVEEYREQELPVEIRQVEDLVTRRRTDLQGFLERLKDAHRSLYAGTGDILAMLPPDPKKVDKIRSAYRLSPPSLQCARRMAFALEALAYLKAVRYKNVNPMDRQRYDTAADQGIPKLGGALKDYKQAWKDLVEAYEQPEA